MTRKGPDRHLLERELTSEIIGAFYETYNVLGYGFLESVYRRALATELRRRGRECTEEGLIEVSYKDVVVGAYRFDLLVDQRVLVEVKAGEAMSATARRQLLNYLRGTGHVVGLLLHFGPAPKFQRCIHERSLEPA